MSSYHLRKELFFDAIIANPFSKLGHWQFLVSFIGALIQYYYITDTKIFYCCILDWFSMLTIISTTVMISICRWPMIIIAHIHSLAPYAIPVRKFEYEVKKWMRGGKHKVTTVEVPRQPYVQDGMIKCGDPNCKMMH